MASSKTLRTLAACAFMAACIAGTARAEDEGTSMMIFPISPYFTDGVRSEHVNVVNNSSTPATFRVSLTYEKQGPDGVPQHLESSPDPSFDLGKILIYSPRQVFLQPGDTQTIKLALRRPENFPEGEQRVYLKLSRMDDAGATSRLNVPNDGKSLVARIGMQVGYAVPVIVRHGKSDAVAKLGGFKLVPPSGKTKTQNLDMVIERSGKFSTMGRLQAFWTPPGQPERVVGKMGSVNVFPENNRRTVSLPLTETVTGGMLRVLYDGGTDTPDQGVTFDEKTFPVTG
jgi:fimbrial chaperone protein